MGADWWGRYANISARPLLLLQGHLGDVVWWFMLSFIIACTFSFRDVPFSILETKNFDPANCHQIFFQKISTPPPPQHGFSLKRTIYSKLPPSNIDFFLNFFTFSHVPPPTMLNGTALMRKHYSRQNYPRVLNIIVASNE